jgi:hypothetical protein
VKPPSTTTARAAAGGVGGCNAQHLKHQSHDNGPPTKAKQRQHMYSAYSMSCPPFPLPKHHSSSVRGYRPPEEPEGNPIPIKFGSYALNLNPSPGIARLCDRLANEEPARGQRFAYHSLLANPERHWTPLTLPGVQLA